MQYFRNFSVANMFVMTVRGRDGGGRKGKERKDLVFFKEDKEDESKENKIGRVLCVVQFCLVRTRCIED